MAPHVAIMDSERFQDAYKVLFVRGDEEFELEPFVSEEEAALVVDALEIKAALDAGADLNSLQLYSKQGPPSLRWLDGPLRSVVDEVPFEDVAAQLQACALVVADSAPPEDDPAEGLVLNADWGFVEELRTPARDCAPALPHNDGQALLSAALALRYPAAVALLVAAAPAAAGQLLGPYSPFCDALRMAFERGGSLPLQLLLASVPQLALGADSQGRTALHLAADAGCLEAVSALLSCDAATAAQRALKRDSRGWTAAHRAAAHGHACVLSVLLAAEPAAASQEDAAGWLPLEVGVRQIIFAYKLPAVARALLPYGSSSRVLRALNRGGARLLPLFADFIACRPPLNEAEWALVPSSCPGLSRALPAALAHSPEQASQLVSRLLASDAERLRLFALCLHRAQSRLHIYLPQPLAWRILSLFDA